MSKRRWFQFHLSTAIVLMFVADGLLWANFNFGNVLHLYDGSFRHQYGWPFALEKPYEYALTRDRGCLVTMKWSPFGIVGNAAVETAVLFAIGVLCEWLIYKKAAKRQALDMRQLKASEWRKRRKAPKS